MLIFTLDNPLSTNRPSWATRLVFFLTSALFECTTPTVTPTTPISMVTR